VQGGEELGHQEVGDTHRFPAVLFSDHKHYLLHLLLGLAGTVCGQLDLRKTYPSAIAPIIDEESFLEGVKIIC